MIHHRGEKYALAWARGIVRNFAGGEYRGDTGNAQAVSDGKADIGFINSYYLGYMLTGGDWAPDPRAVDNLGVACMGQADLGQPVNVTGAGINSRSGREADARRLIEWLVSPRGQDLLSAHVFKYPVRADVEPSPYLKSLGGFRADVTDLNDLELLYDTVDRVMRQAGWKQTW